MLHEGAREQADAVLCFHFLCAEKRNPADAAARGAAFEHVPGEVQLFEFPDATTAPLLHGLRMVNAGCDRYKARCLGAADEPHRLARHAKARFHLWADRHPFHVTADNVRQEAVPFVPAIVSNVVAEQALADPNTERVPFHVGSLAGC